MTSPAFALADHAVRFPEEPSMIPIESGIPIPKGYGWGHSYRLRTVLIRMKIGDSFMWEVDNRHVYEIAKELGVRIKTRKLASGGWRVWRVS